MGRAARVIILPMIVRSPNLPPLAHIHHKVQPAVSRFAASLR